MFHGTDGDVLRGVQNEAARSLRDKIKDKEQTERATTIINTKNKHKNNNNNKEHDQ